MTDLEKNDILEQLARRGVNRPCPRCTNKAFSLLEIIFSLPAPNDPVDPRDWIRRPGGMPQTWTNTPYGVPYVVTVCTNCGFMSEHSLGVVQGPPDVRR